MAITTKFNLDMSSFRKGIAQAKAQIEAYGNRVKDVARRTKQQLQTGLEVGGVSGDKFGKLSEFIGNFGKLGIIALGAASAMKVLNAAFDAHAEKLQNNIQRTQANSEEIRKAAEADKKRADQHKKMMDDLQRLSEVENKSAAEKDQATRLVDRLNRAYKDLGLTISETTGEITGLDGAQKKMLEQQFARQQKYLKMQIQSAEQEGKALQKAFAWQTGTWAAIGDYVSGGKFAQMALDSSKQQIAITDKLAMLYEQLDQLTQDQSAAVTQIEAVKNSKVREAANARQSDIDKMAEDNYMKEYAMNHSALETELEQYRRKWSKDRAEGKAVGFDAAIEREIRKKHELLALEKKLAAEADARKQKELEAENARRKKEEERKRAAEAAKRAEEQNERKELAEMQNRLREHQGRKISNMAVVTNSLTARGGFAAGGRVSGVSEYNRKILSYNEQQKRLLSDISKQMQKVTQEI